MGYSLCYHGNYERPVGEHPPSVADIEAVVAAATAAAEMDVSQSANYRAGLNVSLADKHPADLDVSHATNHHDVDK